MSEPLTLRLRLRHTIEHDRVTFYAPADGRNAAKALEDELFRLIEAETFRLRDGLCNGLFLRIAPVVVRQAILDRGLSAADIAEAVVGIVNAILERMVEG